VQPVQSYTKPSLPQSRQAVTPAPQSRENVAPAQQVTKPVAQQVVPRATQQPTPVQEQPLDDLENLVTTVGQADEIEEYNQYFDEED
jgi:hypothetical protein